LTRIPFLRSSSGSSTSSNGANRIEPETSARSAIAHLSSEVYHFGPLLRIESRLSEIRYIIDFAE
jgi:hypothetical protein